MRNRLKVLVLILALVLFSAFLALYTGRTGLREQPVQSRDLGAAPTPIKPAVKLDCSGCHGPDKKLPVLGDEKFHKNEHSDVTASVHAKLTPDGKPAASCADCHTKDGDLATALPSDNPSSTVHPGNQVQTCGACHANSTQSFQFSIHGSLIGAGEIRSASCSDCHGAHNILTVKDPESNLSGKHLLEACVSCHSTIVPDYEASSHGKAFKAGQKDAPSCTDCHTAVSHNRAPDSTRDFSLQMIDTCSRCHQEQAPSYRDTFHGQATAFGYKPSATCADCHSPHRNLPSTDPTSTVHPSNLVQTCSTCHVDANSSFSTYNPHPEPKNPEKGYATYLVYTFMTWLLFGVFTFFGIHTALWLQRSLVAVLRGEIVKPERKEGDPYVRRFERQHRFTHLLIVISFLGLAATGLPLMYSFTDWGQWVVALHGGLGVTRFLHRFCAIITMVYAAYHVWFILKKAFVERDLKAFWGSESMVARKQDFIDLFKMFRWYFYLGPKPKLDRFTYWEKFDYFAVFWGVPVIGLSGFMLWFPNFFTSFLPGEALNIAMIVHGEEALLATAFIFAFHFFHSHMRPENFPMDMVMFTGRMRLSRFIEERPAEYERLVRENRLESIIVPPPSEPFLKFAKIFGYAAYIIGTLLVVFMFVTLITARF